MNESKSIHLEVTDEFYLSPIVLTDKAAYLEHFADPEIAHNLLAIPFPYTEADADWCLDRCEQSIGSPMTNFALRAPSSYLIGAVGVVGTLSADAHSAEFGYWLAQSYRGRGLMPRVIRTFSDYAFQELRIHRLFATPFSSNLASHRALEKAGFQPKGYSDITTSSKAFTSMQLSMDAFLPPIETPNQAMQRTASELALDRRAAIVHRLATAPLRRPIRRGCRMKKSEDTPVEECSKARRVPTETGFKLRVALPSSQQLKGYPSVTLAITSGASAGERQSAPRCNGLSAN